MRRLRRTLTVGLFSLTTFVLVACINELPVGMREGTLAVDLEVTPGAVMVGLADTVELFVEVDGTELTGLRVRWTALDTTALAVRSLADSLALGGELVDSLDATLFGEIAYLKRGSSSFLIQFDSVGFANVEVGAVDLFVEERWQSVSAGNGHTCAVTLANTFQNALQVPLRRGGEVFCWGEGIFGALGTGSLDIRETPSRALSDRVFQDVRGGAGYTCGRDTTGLLYCWGDNFNGQLGLGNDLDQFVPRLVALGEAFASFDVGKDDQFTCATRRAFGVADLFAETLCWGKNDLGQLGCGGDAVEGCDLDGLSQPNTADLLAVVRESDGQALNFKSLSVGGSHACGVEDGTGTVYCWGSNDSGQLGLDPITLDSAFAVALPGPPFEFEEVAAGRDFTCGIEQGRSSVSCWGATLGHVPTSVAGISGGGLHSLSAGGEHACVLTDAGRAYCWGDNSSGQLGNGMSGSSATAVEVVRPQDPDTDEFVRFGVLSAGQFHTCAITTEPFELRIRGEDAPNVPPSGGIYCWGDNEFGQLGNGTFTNSSAPVRVEEPDEDF